VRALAERVDRFLEAGEVDSWREVRLPGLGAPVGEMRDVDDGREFALRPQVGDVGIMGAKIEHGVRLALFSSLPAFASVLCWRDYANKHVIACPSPIGRCG
jgi:hypothetical protein